MRFFDFAILLLSIVLDIHTSSGIKSSLSVRLSSCHSCRIPFLKPQCEQPHQQRNQIVYDDNCICNSGASKQKCPCCCQHIQQAPRCGKNIIRPHKKRILTCTFTAITIFYICGAQRFLCQAGNQPEQAKYQITCICGNIPVSGDIRSSGKNRNGEYREPVPNHQFMISHQERDGGCHGQCNHRPRCRIIRNRNPKGNPWDQHGCHSRFFLFRRIRTCCLCFIDCSGVSEEFIPINHQRKIPGHRVHCLLYTSPSPRDS